MERPQILAIHHLKNQKSISFLSFPRNSHAEREREKRSENPKKK